MKLYLILTFVVIFSSCVSVPKNHGSDALLDSFEKIDTSDGLSPQEATTIFGVYRHLCPHSTAFHVGNPAFYNGVWVAPLYVGDIAPMPSSVSIVLDPNSGKMYFTPSEEVLVSHFKNIYEECNKLQLP